ncbi:alpha/beta fold hydrolase [Roseateles sp. SL47]|uniref:esterase/lipase family protein n=1 Tax=Roseateles sp. SL47 TaxID=2995138 RepID=UPI00226E227A|nr:alpha/beta fold hydrolase [Roseateles sp. SL47]WAC74607.1 alpha/beta fold hydrolase [Roseateles sp. SL47]
MNGLLHRLTSLFRCFGGSLLTAWATYRYGLGVGVGVLALFVAGPALVMLPSFLALRFFPPAPGLPVAAWADLFHAWWREVVVVTRVFSWDQPWAEHRCPDHLPSGTTAPRGVLLLHGYSCNRGLWNHWMKRLREDDIPFIAVTLEPAFGSIDSYAPTIEAAMRQLQTLCGRPPLIVAHSMGGLSARAWWRSVGHAPDRIHRILSLGTPHHGTALARLGTTVNARQMRGDSPWLLQLASEEPDTLGGHFECIYGHCDQIVFPSETAVLPGARVVHLAARGHLQLVFEPEAYDRAISLIHTVEAGPGVRPLPSAHRAGSDPARYSQTTP